MGNDGIKVFLGWIVAGVMATFIAGVFIIPYIGPWYWELATPKGSLYVSVRFKENPNELVVGKDLSQLVLLSGDHLVDIAYSRKGSHRWDNLRGWYVVKAYINDMYAGQVNVEVQPRKTTEAQIVTELAQSRVQIEVVASDGKTPVEGATVEVISYLGESYRKEVTNSEGQTREFWIARTTAEHEYYSIYAYKMKDSARIIIASNKKEKINEPMQNFTLRAR